MCFKEKCFGTLIHAGFSEFKSLRKTSRNKIVWGPFSDVSVIGILFG